MSEELESHWRGEEDGLFAAMGSDELYAEHIAPLVQEHRELALLLESVDLVNPRDQARVRQAIHDLHGHIAKEEDGLFPASLTALSGEHWDAAIQAWQRAHPGRNLIADAHNQHSWPS
jgi:iron-sulfur cluster repair protein YtfE (RIC family)